MTRSTRAFTTLLVDSNDGTECTSASRRGQERGLSKFLTR